MRLYHGGVAGLRVGDELVPSPPHVTDGCPICVARSEGRVFTVGEFRAWMETLGPRGIHALRFLEGVPDSSPVDPPSAEDAVYMTSHVGYATWYAARSQGDLYRVEPIGRVTASDEDHFPTFIAPKARVIEVIRRTVRLTRRERREILREWTKADERRARESVAS